MLWKETWTCAWDIVAYVEDMPPPGGTTLSLHLDSCQIEIRDSGPKVIRIVECIFQNSRVCTLQITPLSRLEMKIGQTRLLDELSLLCCLSERAWVDWSGLAQSSNTVCQLPHCHSARQGCNTTQRPWRPRCFHLESWHGRECRSCTRVLFYAKYSLYLIWWPKRIGFRSDERQ